MILIVAFFLGAFAVYLEPWHSDIFEFLDLRKNHGKVYSIDKQFVRISDNSVSAYFLFT